MDTMGADIMRKGLSWEEMHDHNDMGPILRNQRQFDVSNSERTNEGVNLNAC